LRLPFFSPKIEHLDLYIAKKAYDKALGAIETELARNPKNSRLRRRQAEIFRMAGENENAVETLRDLAREYSEEGFHTRAVALYKEILELDPTRLDVHEELAGLIGDAKPEYLRQPDSSEASDDDQVSKELASSALFALFEGDALKEVLSSTCLRSYRQGDIIVTEGEEGSSLFVIVDGEVRVFTRGTRGEHVPLAELGAGDLFGEVSVLHGKPRTATITASAPTTAIEIDKENIDRIAGQHPKVRELLERFCEERAQNAIERLIGAAALSGADS